MDGYFGFSGTARIEPATNNYFELASILFFFRLRSRSFIFKNADAQTTQKQQKIFFRLLSVRDAFFSDILECFSCATWT